MRKLTSCFWREDNFLEFVKISAEKLLLEYQSYLNLKKIFIMYEIKNNFVHTKFWAFACATRNMFHVTHVTFFM